MISTLSTLLASPIPIPRAALVSALGGYRQPNDKISVLLTSGVLLGLKRGVYVSSRAVVQYGAQSLIKLAANTLYGPSYLSGIFALAHYGLIPERVHHATAMTTRRAKCYQTPIGAVRYAQCPNDWFSVGLCLQTDAAGTSLFASPEKALCDHLIYTPSLGIHSFKSMQAYLFEDLRCDELAMQQLDASAVLACMAAARPLRLKLQQLEWLYACIR